MLCDVGLNRVRMRLAAPEALAAAEGGPLTERALRACAQQRIEHRHLGEELVGEQVIFDTMYIGQLDVALAEMNGWQKDGSTHVDEFPASMMTSRLDLSSHAKLRSSIPRETPTATWPVRVANAGTKRPTVRASLPWLTP